MKRHEARTGRTPRRGQARREGMTIHFGGSVAIRRSFVEPQWKAKLIVSTL
jgi:hypothetical protein